MREQSSRNVGAICFAVAAAVLPVLVVGCMVPSSPAPSAGSTSAAVPPDAVPPDAAAAAVTPMVVDVDPDRTLIAAPGDGVGVFAEYTTGGHWRVWWTCDSNATRQACAFQVDVSTLGSIANLVTSQSNPADRVTQVSSHETLATTNTTTGLDSIEFDTVAGNSITLDAVLTPQPTQNFFFFVQNGVVNGGYQGNLTDPLILQPSAP